jgi:hypothetical protein
LQKLRSAAAFGSFGSVSVRKKPRTEQFEIKKGLFDVFGRWLLIQLVSYVSENTK